MAIEILTGGTQSGGVNNGNPVTLTFPTLSENDVVIVFGGHNATAGQSVIPTDYTPIYDSGAGNGTPHFGVSYKVMGASPDATVSCPGDGAAADGTAYACFCLRGVDTTAINDASAVPAGPTAGGNPDCPQIITVTDGAVVLALALDHIAGTGDTSITNPTNYTEGGQRTARGADSNDATVCGGALTKAAHGTENPPSFTTWTTGTWRAVTVAIRPKAATVWQGTSVLAGDSALALDTTIKPPATEWQATSVLVGSGALDVSADRFVTASTLLTASGALFADSSRTLQATAALIGDSAFVTDATIPSPEPVTWDGTAVLTGDSALAVDLVLLTNFVTGLYDETGATTTLDLPAGGVTEFEFGLALDLDSLPAGETVSFRVYSNSTPLNEYAQTAVITVQPHNIAAAVKFVGGSDFTASAATSIGWQATSALIGDGALAASVSLALTARAAWQDVSTLAVDATVKGVILATSALVGTGTLAVQSSLYRPVAASVAGLSTLSAGVALQLTASEQLAGSAALTALPWQRLVASARLVASGSADIFATIAGAVTAWPASALLVSASAISAATRQRLVAQSALAGVAALTATTLHRAQISVRPVGAGLLAATVWLRQPASGRFAGAGAIAALATVKPPDVVAWQGSSAMLAGSSLVAAAALRLSAAAVLAGASDLLVTVQATTGASAALTAIGTAIARSQIVMPALAQFDASSAMMANGLSIGAEEAFFTLAAAGGMRINAIKPRRRWRGIANLHGKASLRIPLQGSLANVDHIRGG